MDPFSAGRTSRSIDPLHSISYFAPDAAERFGELGMEGRTPYFAARSAPMGAVGAATVAATFYNFSPELVAKSIPSAWDLASPQTVTSVRYEIVEQAIPRVLGDLAYSEHLAQVTTILRRAAEAIPDGDGRPLYAAHAELPWPQSVHGQLWHGVTLLREYRGDGHITALMANGLSGLEALISHTAAGIGFSVGFALKLRGWSEDQWADGAEGLRRRGLLDDSGVLTPAGFDLRSAVEDLTDRLAFEPWRTLSDDDAADVMTLAKGIRERAAGLFPPGAFGPRYGEHR